LPRIAADQAPEKGADLDAPRPLRRAQDGGDEAALAIEDDDRLEAVVVIMGVARIPKWGYIEGVPRASM
jgi:hypothetical protein